MDYLRLMIAAALPWAAGYFCLAAIEKRLGAGSANPFRQVGYGLFVGYAGLQAIVLSYDSLAGAITFWPITIILAVLVVAASLFHGKSATGPATGPDRPLPQSLASSATNFFSAFLIVWIILHLTLNSIEILHRPVFPWDASLNWMYRAKAWFYEGTITALDSPQQWLEGTGQALYNVPGNHYPTFTPIVALWSAVSLGQWSETLVALPLLFCGVALTAGMYGQCRDYGLPRWLSLIGTYLLISLPLAGAHLSLAGLADIWMAGFTGLGFVALLHGVMRSDHYQVLLGLFMIALGAANKLEGAIWFAAALLTFALEKRPQGTVASLSIVTGLALVGVLATGVTHVDLPLVGGLGVIENRLHIPFIGSYAIQSFDLWDDYRDNFFAGGTWHLLWTLVLLTAASLLFLPSGQPRRTIAIFYGVILCAQMFIFQATESGNWAEDWTAINRLPLHFAPVLAFSVAIVAWEHLRVGLAGARNGLRYGIPALSLVITLILSLGYLLLSHPRTTGERETFTGSDTSIVIGAGRLAGDVGIIDSFKNNTAIVSSGPVSLDASRLQLLRLRTEGSRDGHVTFFWRNGTTPQDLHSTEITGPGIRWVDLGSLVAWSGHITELGLVFYADGDNPAEMHFLELAPSSLQLQLRKLAHDWSQTSLWSQQSSNWIPAGSSDSLLPLPILMACWVLFTVILVAALRWNGHRCYPAVLACALVAWILLDLRWTVTRLGQASNTMSEYPFASASFLEFGDDEITHKLVSNARTTIHHPEKRTVVMGESSNMGFQLQRAKYHALPARMYFHEGSLNNLPTHISDYVLVLRQVYAKPGQAPATAAGYAREISARFGLEARPVWDKPEGFLISIKGNRPLLEGPGR